MFHRQETTGSEADQRGVEVPAIDLNRLRATLRLIFDGDTVDRIAVNLGTTSLERTIKQVASALQWEWRLLKLRRRLRRGGEPDLDRPLDPRSGISARGALTLALHLGFGLPIETLARATSIGAEALGNDLYQARVTLVPGIKPACGQFISSIGRYRDGSLDIAARATLIQHAQRCPACRAALDRFQAVDAQLLDRIEQAQAALPPLTEPAKAHAVAGLRKPIALIAVPILNIVIIGAGGYAIAGRRGNATEAASSGQQLSGWLVTADVAGNLLAFNLATGEQRRFDADTQPARPGFVPSSTALSPDGTLIANQVASAAQSQSQDLVIETTGAKKINTIRLSEPSIRFAGWLGNDTVLEISYPSQETGESADDYFTRAQTHAVLSGFNITTGHEQQLFTGAVSDVFPSPDGTMIAIVSNSVQSNSGLRRMELRRIQAARVSDTVASVTDRVASDTIVSLSGLTSSVLIWAPDSSRVFMATIDTLSAATPTPAISASPIPASPPSTTIMSIARDGTIQAVPLPPDATAAVPITLAPDGSRLIVQSIRTSGTGYQYRVSALSLSTNSYHAMTDWSPNAINSPIWSPDRTTLLGFERQPFLIPAIGSQFDINISVIRVVVLPDDGGRFTAMTRMAGNIGSNFFAWLPENVLSAPPEQPLPIRLGQPRPVALAQADLGIATSAQVSRNDDYVNLHNATDQRPYIWDRTANVARALPLGTHDLSWFPHTSALIGVGTTDPGRATAPSRLVTYAPAFVVAPPDYDYRAYDPARIGFSLDKEYNTPLMSPDENTLAFYVFDTRDHSVTLWLAGYEAPAKSVAHWALPNDNKLSYGPIAGWLDSQTLLYAEPGNWQSGLPGEVQLKRLTLQDDGDVSIDTVDTLHPHGTERGIALDELAINQTSGEIAYRLRHFTKNSTNDGIIDTISIASAGKLSDALEISRGGSSSGLSWSPDGRILAATTPYALEFYSASGNALFGAAGLDFPNEPRWIDEHTVWFNESNDQGTKVMSVDLQ
jgi:hypothetical protein